MQTVILNNGVEMPILGFGVHQIPPEQTGQAGSDALEVGHRHIDTAAEQMDRIAGLDSGASAYFDHRDPAIVSWIGGSRS